MFTHLHLHTEYSLLDGLTRIPALMDHIKEMGQEAVAMTDHGALYGAIDFYRTARKNGIKPIIGVEAYVAPGSRLTRDVGDKQPFHMTMLARNNTGYRNLLKLVTSSHLEGYYYRPRMDRDILAKYSEGITVLSGCPSSELQRAVQEGRMDEAREVIKWYREVFDGNYYLEVQDTSELPEFTEPTRKIVELGREMGVPLVATNDSHYLTADDHDSHDVLLCIGTNSTVQDEKRMKMFGSLYVRSEADMRDTFSHLPEAIDNTWKIAEQCDLSLEFGRLHMPEPDTPAGETSFEYLSRLCWEGLRRRMPHASAEDEERLRYELEVVEHTGFPNYMHIVREIATFARGAGIRFGVRGSAAASLILYCLNVTDIDPLKANLVFERFLNKERPEAPDVDFDFPDDKREAVLSFISNRYGADRVAQIITFGTLGAKAAIRDVGRALGMSYADTDRVARLIPSAVHMTLDRAMSEVQELTQIYEQDSQVRRLVDQAKKLEGVARNQSTHAAGVVISRDPLVEHLALARPARGEAQALPTTQFPMENVAAIGLVKMDILGLSNLTILQNTVELIKARHGIEVDLANLPDGDEKTFEMLGKGDTFGVFQLESSGMRRAVLELKPTSVDDLAALVALYRPGPMQHIGTFCRAKHGLEEIKYPHPDLADILNPTYGIIVYQDQVLKIAQKFGGYTLGAADIMRKAMGKKIASVMAEQRVTFNAGAIRLGYTEEDANKVFDLIEPFAGYAFNKAHSYSYGTIAYQTAWLKSNYAEEYLTAVFMQADAHPSGALERIAQAFSECMRIGIPVLPPDLNKSMINFSLEEMEDGKQAIRFGLSMIKNVGEGAAESILESRAAAGGSFTSLDELCRNLNTHNVNKRALESLVKAGALDSVAGKPDARGSLLLNLDRILSIAQSTLKLKETGQTSMFDLFGTPEEQPLSGIDLTSAPLPKSEMLSWEKELLGVWISEHPFTHAAPILTGYTTASCGELTLEQLTDLPNAGRDYVIAGMVGSARRLNTRDGRSFVAVEIEDFSGIIEVTVWPDVYERTMDLWTPGQIILAQVKVRERGDRLSAGVNEVVPFDDDFVVPYWVTNPAPETPRRNGYGSNGNGFANRNAYSNGNGASTTNGGSYAADEPPAYLSASAEPDEAPAPVFEPKRFDPRPPALSPEPITPAASVVPQPSVAPIAPMRAPEPAPAVQTAAFQPPAPQQTSGASALYLQLVESPDEAGDQQRLASVFNLLKANPGHDDVFLTIRTREGETIDLSLPSASLDDRLRAQLQEAISDAYVAAG